MTNPSVFSLQQNREATLNSRFSFALAIILGALLIFSPAHANHHHKKNKDQDAADKNAETTQSGKVTPESDRGSKDTKTTTTTPALSTTNTNQSVLWGDYTIPPKQ